jgi:methylated-DNA-[protein]-cysteine S-methyltransferase
MTASQLSLYRAEERHPIGPILIVTEKRTLVALDFDAPDGRLSRLLRTRFGDYVLREARDDINDIELALRAYLEGDFDALNSIPVDGGGTDFQRRAWAALRQIPAGETRTYGQMAGVLGKPNAARAVGLANALNPISLFVPCHRLVGSTGALTGYGGGIERKRWVLEHERRSL